MSLVRMKTISTGEGYLLNDNRCSGGKLEEAAMLGCNHCQKLIVKSEWQADGAFCHCCDAPVCGPCGDRARYVGCAPFLKTLEQAIEETYRREQNAKILGL